MAQPRWQVDPAHLPPAMSAEKAAAILKEIDRKTAGELAAEEAAQQRKAERVQRAARKYEERLARAVEKDPELRALKEKLEAGMKALDNPALSEEQRRERLERMAPDLKALRSKGLAKAGIDKRAMNGEIRQALSGGVTPRGEAAEEEGMLQEQDGAFYYKTAADDELPPASKVTTRGTNTITLTAPWPYAEERTPISGTDSYVDKDAGEYKAVAKARYVGYGTNYRGLAHFQPVPQGTTMIRVTAQLPETEFYNSAWAFAAGGAQSRSFSIIEVWAANQERICRKYVSHANVWAVVVGYFRQAGSESIILECPVEEDKVPAGEEVVIKFLSGASVQAWGAGSAYSRAKGKPADITVELISPDPTFSIPQRYYTLPR